MKSKRNCYIDMSFFQFLKSFVNKKFFRIKEGPDILSWGVKRIIHWKFKLYRMKTEGSIVVLRSTFWKNQLLGDGKRGRDTAFFQFFEFYSNWVGFSVKVCSQNYLSFAILHIFLFYKHDWKMNDLSCRAKKRQKTRKRRPFFSGILILFINN